MDLPLQEGKGRKEVQWCIVMQKVRAHPGETFGCGNSMFHWIVRYGLQDVSLGPEEQSAKV